jgi:hypothetical protein
MGGTSRGYAGGDESSGLRGRKIPEGQNPTNVTRLKMAGRRGEEQRRCEVGKTCERHRSWRGGTRWRTPWHHQGARAGKPAWDVDSLLLER